MLAFCLIQEEELINSVPFASVTRHAPLIGNFSIKRLALFACIRVTRASDVDQTAARVENAASSDEMNFCRCGCWKLNSAAL